MNVLQVLVSYVIGFLLIGLIGWLREVLVWPLVPVLRRARALLPPVRFALHLVTTLAALYLVARLDGENWFRGAMSIAAVPALIQLKNDLSRIAAARAGKSGVKRLLERSGDADEYDQRADVRTEQASFAGTLLGYLSGIPFFLGKLPLI